MGDEQYEAAKKLVEKEMALRREVVTLGEAREVEEPIKGFLSKGWDKRDPENKIRHYDVIMEEQILPLKEIYKNLEKYVGLVKTTKEEILRWGDDDSIISLPTSGNFTQFFGFQARRTKKGIEFAQLQNSVGHHNCLAQKIEPETWYPIGIITDFKSSKGSNSVTFYGFGLSDDVREVLDDSELCNIISEANSKASMPISYPSDCSASMYMRVKGKLTDEWVPLAFRLHSLGDGFSFGTSFDDDYLVIQYPDGVSLENALIKDYVKPHSVANGVKVYSEASVPKYLQRKLGL